MLAVFLMAVSMFAQAQAQPAQAQQAKPQATVHIYRYRLSVGTAAHPTVSCDSFPVARIQNGRVYTFKVSGGRHLFTVADSSTGLNVDVEPGREYFVRLDYPANAKYLSNPIPMLVAAEQGSQEMQKLKPLDKWFIENATCGQP